VTLDLTPKPGAAPWPSRLWAHVRMELRLLSRQGEQLLLTIVIPLMVLILGSKAGSLLKTEAPLDVVLPGVLALALVSMSFTSLAIGTGFERRYGVLKHLGATPLSPQGLLWGKALAIALAQGVQGLLLFGVALVLGWRPQADTSWLSFCALVVVGSLAFAGLALLLAGSFRAEITLALANLLFILASAFGGVVVSVDRLPAPLAPLVAYSPTGALGEGMRAVFASEPASAHVVVLLLWAIVAGVACMKWFKWE